MSFLTSARIINSNIAFAALIAGLLAISVELARPGLILPGAAGAVLVLLALFALPLDALAAALLVASLVLFLLEARYAARGVLGGAAAGSLVLCALRMHVHPAVALALALPFSLFATRRLSLVFRARRNKRVAPPRQPL